MQAEIDSGFGFDSDLKTCQTVRNQGFAQAVTESNSDSDSDSGLKTC